MARAVVFNDCLGREFLIATTSILTGSSIIDGISGTSRNTGMKDATI
jgi:hypothetical protein